MRQSKNRIACFAALALAAAFAAPARADVPPGKSDSFSLPATCDGQQVTLTPSGPNLWSSGGQHYVLKSITVYPTDGAPFTQDLGEKTGLAPYATCTGSWPDGTATFVATLGTVASH
jgi:hypothetical protein